MLGVVEVEGGVAVVVFIVVVVGVGSPCTTTLATSGSPICQGFS